ncbi:MAG: hypothetical protein IKN46_02010 [Acholeplasmatales bacterium]|nr:hypothetical protein [Acholeplasmatales bacterium]
MRTASRILILIGAIFSIIMATTFVIVGLVFLGISADKASLLEGINNGSIRTSTPGTPEEQAAALQLTFQIIAYVFLVIAFLNICNSVISFVARKIQSNALYITCLILGFISFVEINSFGSIFGLIANKKEKTIV